MKKINDRPMFYHRDGTPYLGKNATLDWAKDFENREYKVVKQEKVGYFFVSTVWLGLDNSFLFLGKPLIFESMVFCRFPSLGSKLPCSDLDIDRYHTEEEAKAGHEVMLKEWQKPKHTLAHIFKHPWIKR